jgi:HTH-type transcriptional regulator/antitoxin HipB
MKDKPLKTYSLDEVTDKYIGKPGTSRREAFENDNNQSIQSIKC